MHLKGFWGGDDLNASRTFRLVLSQGKYVFAQISTFLPQRVFDRIASNCNGNYKIRRFSCWNQMMCMMLGQLSNRESLSGLALSINAHPARFYHLGFGKGVSKASLAKTNEKRDWHIYPEYAYHLIEAAGKSCLPDDATAFSFSNAAYAFDSTAIDLCLNVFCRAAFRRAKGAVKLHTQYDARTCIPVFMHVTAASVHDANAMDQITCEAGSFYIFDRGYLDFERLHSIRQAKSFFVIRAKNNLRSDRAYSSPVDKKTGVQCGQPGYLKGFYSLQGYPEKIRRVRFHDKEQSSTFVFLTSNMQLKPEEIAAIYKHGRKIELLFKWIKQHLEINTF